LKIVQQKKGNTAKQTTFLMTFHLVWQNADKVLDNEINFTEKTFVLFNPGTTERISILVELFLWFF